MSAWGVPTPPVGQIREPMLDSRLEWICAAVRKNGTAEFEHYEALLDHLADFQTQASVYAHNRTQEHLALLHHLSEAEQALSQVENRLIQQLNHVALVRAADNDVLYDRLDFIERELFPLLCRSVWRSIRRLWRRVWPSR